MSEGGIPSRTETDHFPVVGEPPPPPGASPSGVPSDGTRDSAFGPFGDDPPGQDRAGLGAGDTEDLSDPGAGAGAGWGGGSPRGARSLAGAGRKVARAAEQHLRDESPWVLGSAALLVALAAYWVDSILMAFQHAPGVTGQDRVLDLLAPGSFVWGAGILLAVALHAAGRHFEIAPAEPWPLRRHLPDVLLAAAAASATAAALDVLVELANFGHGIDRALAGLVGYLGVIALAGAAAWWAHLESRAVRDRAIGRR